MAAGDHSGSAINPGDWTSAPAPACPPGQILAWLATGWGLSGRLERLYAERDLNHRLTTPGGTRWLVKLSHPDTPHARLVFEQRVLAGLAGDPSAPLVPGVLPTGDGASLLPVPGGGHLRVLTWLDGTALGDTDTGAAGREALGRCCARLNRALAALTATAGTGVAPLPRDLPWDLLAFERLAPLAEALTDRAARALARSTLAAFGAEALPLLGTLPRQLIHNDLNPDNLLVDAASPGALPAVIDFGDMVHAPAVCDLAIACAYHVDATNEDPLRGVRDIVRGFHAERPMHSTEKELLPMLIAARLTQTLLIQGTRLEGGALEQKETVRTALRRLESLRLKDRAQLAACIRSACEASDVDPQAAT